MEEIKKEISSYWTGRSEDFARLREEELNSEMAELWLRELKKGLPEGEHLRILDVGTGCGFFTVLLAKLGHQVTGIDLTPAMIEKARIIAAERNVQADFEVMDAEHPDFPDGTFDVIVSRNLTWTLPHPAEAYGEWLRVLKDGGVILNFDADYGKEDLLGELIGAGIMGHIALQVILNIAVVTNTIPNTGITLPFISYGGTSVLFLMGEMGLALSVTRYSRAA